MGFSKHTALPSASHGPARLAARQPLSLHRSLLKDGFPCFGYSMVQYPAVPCSAGLYHRTSKKGSGFQELDMDGSNLVHDWKLRDLQACGPVECHYASTLCIAFPFRQHAIEILCNKYARNRQARQPHQSAMTSVDQMEPAASAASATCPHWPMQGPGTSCEGSWA